MTKKSNRLSRGGLPIVPLLGTIFLYRPTKQLPGSGKGPQSLPWHSSLYKQGGLSSSCS